jgi:hypothetical protein
MVREGREGDRRDEIGLDEQGSHVDDDADCTPVKANQRMGQGVGTEVQWGGVMHTPGQGAHGVRENSGEDGEEDGDGVGAVRWWGPRRWEEEVAEDMWCKSEGVVAAVTQLLRAHGCVHGQHFAARILPALLSRGACRIDAEGNTELMAAVVSALWDFCRVVLTGAGGGGAGAGGAGGGGGAGAGARQGARNTDKERVSDKGQARRIEQRELFGLGGAMHLSLGILRLARFGQGCCQLLVASGAVEALQEALSIRVSNPGGTRLHETAALAVRLHARPLARTHTRKCMHKILDPKPQTPNRKPWCAIGRALVDVPCSSVTAASEGALGHV